MEGKTCLSKVNVIRVSSLDDQYTGKKTAFTLAFSWIKEQIIFHFFSIEMKISHYLLKSDIYGEFEYPSDTQTPCLPCYHLPFCKSVIIYINSARTHPVCPMNRYFLENTFLDMQKFLWRIRNYHLWNIIHSVIAVLNSQFWLRP